MKKTEMIMAYAMNLCLSKKGLTLPLAVKQVKEALKIAEAK